MFGIIQRTEIIDKYISVIVLAAFGRFIFLGVVGLDFTYDRAKII